jgi:tetratricopeptide (TPR) repeat protein
MDRREILKAAERFVRQGRLAQAAEEYHRLAELDPGDLTALNKAGDLYVRLGRNEEAIRLFLRIAEQYIDGGFLPKAIAIFKKILKLDPHRVETHVRLADLFGTQDLLADARAHYAYAAEACQRTGDHEGACAVWAKLLKLAPRDLAARRQLAEAAETLGDGPMASEAWVQVVNQSVHAGDGAGALEAYRRALHCDPLSYPAPLPVVELLQEDGARGDTLLAQAEEAWPDDPALFLIRGEVLRQRGETEAAAGTIQDMVERHPDRMALVMTALRIDLEAGDLEAARGRLADAYQRAEEAGRLEVMLVPLSMLSERLPEDQGLAQRLVEAARAAGERERLHRALLRLAELTESHGDPESAHALRAEAATVDGSAPNAAPADAPPSEVARVLASAGSPAPPTKAPAAARPAPAGTGERTPVEEGIPVAASPPPGLSTEERDFLNEHLTEAEVFLKYGLVAKAVQQLQQVIERFPGHLEAQRKLKTAYLEMGQETDAAERCVVLFQLYTERGETDAARAEHAEAERLSPGVMQDHPGPTPTAETEVDIDLGDVDLPASSPDETLVVAGRVEAPADLAQPPSDGGESILDLAEELGAALAEQEGKETEAVTSSEERHAFEDIFSAFRDEVARTVGEDDAEAHYDLGIAYKEMGLVDEAIVEFQQASRSPDRFLDCCSLLATLFREKGMPEQAEAWCCQGLAAQGYSEADFLELRYALAELYHERGKIPEARELYSQVFGIDAGYREVRERLDTLDQK